MCGIVGYIGNRSAIPELLAGLKKLEYRGYDSAGIGFIDYDVVNVEKVVGPVEGICIPGKKFNIGIGHTRWATHGEPSIKNAHPVVDCTRRFGAVHNGIVENHTQLKAELVGRGHEFYSDTDTEVIAHLLESNPLSTVVGMLEGNSAIVSMDSRDTEQLFFSCRGSPLAIGFGDGECWIASDPIAFVHGTRKVVYLEYGDVGAIGRGWFKVYNRNPVIMQVDYNDSITNRLGYKHYMLKEIHEQPSILGKIASSPITLEPSDALDASSDALNAGRIVLVGCGSSYYAALVARHYMEEIARIPTTVEQASEFRYSEPLAQRDTLMLALSQSGETADTIAAALEAKHRGSSVIAICANQHSTLSRIADATILLDSGTEIAVAATKSFTAQLLVMLKLSLALAARNGIELEERHKNIATDFARMHHLVDSVITLNSKRLEDIGNILGSFVPPTYMGIIGRGLGLGIAYEGALKLKEVAYIPCEAYPAGEMKHGPIALIDGRSQIISLAFGGVVLKKMLSNMSELRSRGANIISLGIEGDDKTARFSNNMIDLPSCNYMVVPILYAVALQLIAYYAAVRKNLPIDKPRNLAKSVTVE